MPSAAIASSACSVVGCQYRIAMNVRTRAALTVQPRFESGGLLAGEPQLRRAAADAARSSPAPTGRATAAMMRATTGCSSAPSGSSMMSRSENRLIEKRLDVGERRRVRRG